MCTCYIGFVAVEASRTVCSARGVLIPVSGEEADCCGCVGMLSGVWDNTFCVPVDHDWWMIIIVQAFVVCGWLCAGVVCCVRTV